MLRKTHWKLLETQRLLFDRRIEMVKNAHSKLMEEQRLLYEQRIETWKARVGLLQQQVEESDKKIKELTTQMNVISTDASNVYEKNHALSCDLKRKEAVKYEWKKISEPAKARERVIFIAEDNTYLLGNFQWNQPYNFHGRKIKAKVIAWHPIIWPPYTS